MMSLLLCALFCSSTFAAGDEHIVLKPVKNDPSLPTKLMVFIPGGKVPNTHYVNTSAAIQAATNVNLWVVIPSVTNRLCIIECSGKNSVLCGALHNSVTKAVQKATSLGFKGDDAPFLVGHSLGGTCANYLLQTFADTDKYSAAVLMGSYVDDSGNGSLSEYKTPILTLGAQLDGGLAKPSRLSLWWDQFQQWQKQHPVSEALATKPVVILPKVDHSDFCPGFPVPGDLPSETAPAAASALIGETVAAFLHLQKTSAQPAATVKAAASLLEDKVAFTEKLLAPFVQAQELEVVGGEGSYGHLSGSSSPWCAQAQHYMATLPPSGAGSIVSADDNYNRGSGPSASAVKTAAKTLVVVDTYFNKSSDPPPCLEHCHNNYTANATHVVTTTCSHNEYEKDAQNTGDNAGAHEIGCKMFSNEKIQSLLSSTGTGAANTIKSSEPTDACKQINQLAIDKAMKLVQTLGQPDVIARYKSRGRGICLGPDFAPPGNIGPLWVSKNLKLTVNNTCMAVESLMDYTGLDSKIYPGVHYCKLLSPARVVEWIMTDSIMPKL